MEHPKKSLVESMHNIRHKQDEFKQSRSLEEKDVEMRKSKTNLKKMHEEKVKNQDKFKPSSKEL